MAYTSSIDYRRPSSQLSIDRKPGTLFDDLESLDSSMLDSNMLSPTTTDRRDSFGNSTAPYFSPQSTPWEDDFPNSASIIPERHFNPFTEQSNNPFTRVESSSFGHNASPWPMVDRTANSQTPVAPTAYETFSSEFDVDPPSAFSDVTSTTPTFGALPVQGNVQPSAVFPPSAAPAPFETSPTDTKDWMSFAEHAVRHIPKRMRNESPPRSYSPFHKRDGGIKKKTARFDIPPERSLDNIDDFIAKCTDEDQLKELKMQKRLLRNRQAALDSRQRKKQHAEDLANQNNAKAEVINHLEEELRNATLQLQAEKEHFVRDRTELYRKIDQLELDKENMVRSHTLETGELRKRIGILTDRLNESGTNTLSHSHSGEFVDFASEMDSLTMGNEWDDYTFINDLNVDGEIQPPQNQTTLVVTPRKKEPASSDSDQPGASGLLLMLLLCGAFVASRSSGSSPPPAIKMPDDVREASTTILETVFKDAGVTPSQSTGNNAVVKLEPTPSGAAWSKASILANTGFTSMASTSNLDGLANQFIAPTKDQEAEQAFSLSAQQYTSLTSTDFTRTVYLTGEEDSPLTPQSSQSGGHRRNLAETLKAMRDEAKGQSAAEVYTRSLLWDRIPTEVVHQFKRMVEESNTLSTSGAGGG